MNDDPDFSDIGKGKSSPGNVWHRVRWLLVYPLLGFSGCHLLLTGSPIPLWYTERLDHPIVVKAITKRTLVLSDGRSLHLPFLKRLPRSDPVFRKAIQHGVEVREDGEVYGLLTVYPNCGNDPYHWYTQRINLSDLAGFMDPDGIDDAIVLPDEIRALKENEERSLDRHGLPYWVMNKAHKMRTIYEFHSERVKQKPDSR